MTIPVFHEMLLPLLEYLGDKQEHASREAIDWLAKQFNLTTEERNVIISSGQQTVFDSRVGWARVYLKKAGLIDYPRRGYSRITDRGFQVLGGKPSKINIKFLEQFKEFQEFYNPIAKEKKKKEPDSKDDTSITPEEALENAYQGLKNKLASDILDQLKAGTSKKFENVVIDLLVAMGYGGSRKEAAKVIGKSSDEGIDGIINEDRLGLDVIYIQAKKWDTTIGRPEIQKFAGALQGQHAKKGIFITTASFSKEAVDFASRVDSKIILIDGNTLVQYMIDHNIGVTPMISYEIKKVDSDYFTEE